MASITPAIQTIADSMQWSTFHVEEFELQEGNDTSGYSAIDLTGGTVEATVRKASDNSEISTLTCTITDAAAGQFHINEFYVDGNTYAADCYYIHVRATLATGAKNPYLMLRWQVTKEGVDDG